MALSTKTGTLIQPNATTGNQAIAGLGFTPKVVLFWSSGTIAATTLTAHAQVSTGVAISAADQRVSAASAQDATSAALTGRRANNTACIAFLNPASSTQVVLATAALVSMDGDGFTINWTVCDAVQRRIHWLALGGADITQVAGGSTASPTSAVAPTNTVPVSVGFAPDLLIFLPTDLTTFPGNSANSGHGFGFAARNGQAGVAENALSGANPTSAGRYQRTDRALTGFGYIAGVATINCQAQVSSFDAAGFTLTYDAVGTAPIYTEYVAIAGLQAAVNTISAPSTSGHDASNRGLGFTPAALLMLSHNGATGTTVQASQHFLLGAATANADQRSAYMGNANNATGGSIAKAYSDATKLINVFVETPSPSGAQSVIASLSGLVADGFDLDWTIPVGDVSTHQYAYMAIGPALAVTNPTGLFLAAQGAAEGLEGTLSVPIEVSMTPGGSSLASGNQMFVTLSIDEYPSAEILPGAVLTLSHSSPRGLLAFTLPAIDGDTDQVVTVRASATGPADSASLVGTLAFTIHPAATGISLVGPTSGASLEESGDFTATLTGGTGLAEPITAVPTDNSGGGHFVPAAITLSDATPAATFRYVGVGAQTVQVGLDNTDPLDPPATISYTTTFGADYSINAPLTVPAGYPTARIRVALRAGLVLSNPLPMALSDDQTGANQGTWFLDGSATPLTPASDGKARITLTQTTRFVDVQYRAAATKGVGTVDTAHLSVLADTPGYVPPAAVPLDVYDPAVFYALNIAATYPGFPGYAGTVTYTVLDDSQVAVYANPTGRVWAGDAAGKYLSTIVMRLDSGGSVTWTEPPGWTGGAAQYEFDAPRAVGPVLSTLDITAMGGARVRLAPLEGDVTSLDEALSDTQKGHQFLLHLRTNTQRDAAGNILVKNTVGATIATLNVVTDDGLTTISPAG